VLAVPVLGPIPLRWGLSKPWLQQRAVGAGAFCFLGFAKFFMNERSAQGTLTGPEPFSLAPNTGFALLLIGVALWLLNSPRQLPRAPAQLVALFPIGVALISLLGYAYSAEGLYGLGELQPMALPTAASLFVLGLGILCACPDVGFVSVIVSDHAGGILARRMLPVAILAGIISRDALWRRWIQLKDLPKSNAHCCELFTGARSCARARLNC